MKLKMNSENVQLIFTSSNKIPIDETKLKISLSDPPTNQQDEWASDNDEDSSGMNADEETRISSRRIKLW